MGQPGSPPEHQHVSQRPPVDFELCACGKCVWKSTRLWSPQTRVPQAQLHCCSGHGGCGDLHPHIYHRCEDVTVAVKRIVDVEQCYPVTRTVCTESVETIPNEICVYTYGPKDIETEAKTVSVVYTTPCVTQMVTVCDPGYQQYGYGHEVHCKEVAQETCYNAPELEDDIQPQTLVVPEPAKV